MKRLLIRLLLEKEGRNHEILKDTILSTAITLVGGLALGVVQEITADSVTETESKAGGL